MPAIYPGRYSTRMEGAFVVFLLGLRINRPLAINKWFPTARSTSPMLRELYAYPALGFLGGFSSFYWPGVMVTQYWRSFDQLVDYAQSRNANHLPAWKDFNQRVGNDGTVGIWHETYQVDPGHHESIYVNMPRFGLAVAGTHEPAVGHLRDAKTRMNAGTSRPT